MDKSPKKTDGRQARISAFPKGYLEKICSGEMTLFEWITEAGTLGADGLELYPLFLRSLEIPYLQQVRDMAEQHRLCFPMMCASPDFTHPDPVFRQVEQEKIKAMIDVMAYLGPEDFRSCRVLSGQNRPGITREQGIGWTVESISTLLPYAEAKNVFLVMENHYKDGFWTYPEFAQSTDIYLDIINRIDSPWFGVNYDPSNALLAGEDPLELLKKVKHRILTMHASDRYLKEGYTLEDLQKYTLVGYSSALAHGVIGKGMNDYDEIFKQLQSVGFRGWISIEDGVNGLDEIRESVEFLKQKRSQYL